MYIRKKCRTYAHFWNYKKIREFSIKYTVEYGGVLLREIN